MAREGEEKGVTLLEKIKQAQSKKELDQLNVEIILQHADFNENQKAYVKRLEELELGNAGRTNYE